MALKDDPKVQDLILKEVTKAVKAETKRCIGVLQDAAAITEDKAEAKVLKAAAKALKA